MCCTLEPAELSSTIVYAGEGIRSHKYVHVMAYQNQAETKGPNAMVLPIPSAKPMSQDNMIDCSGFPGFLKSYREAILPPRRRSRGLSDDHLSLDDDDAVEVFKSGSYTVVLASKSNLIPKAMEQVSTNMRVKINDEFLSSYSTLYPGWHVALCLWNGRVEAEPMLWWYEPLNPDRLFAPALDSHDGGPLDLDTYVPVDHAVIFGSANAYSAGKLVHGFCPPAGNAAGLLPFHVTGEIFNGIMPNGDFYASAKKVRSLTKSETLIRPDRVTPGREDGY